METVVIIGGGASGMMAALTAAEDGSRRVVLLERQQRVGRKLLATGNGRCNLRRRIIMVRTRILSAPRWKNSRRGPRWIISPRWVC